MKSDNMASKYERVADVNLWTYVLIILVNQTVISAMEKDKNTLSSNGSLYTVSYASTGSKCKQMLCLESKYDCYGIMCSQSGPILPYGYCMTYNEDTKLMSMSKCRFLKPEGYNVTSSQHILLPRNISQLNDYMCGPLNRKGLV